jgi:predicted RNase H-like HicB family nuclease
MTDVLNWRPIGERKSLADGLETQRSAFDALVTDQSSPADQRREETFAETRSAELIEDLPKSLVEAYVKRAMGHAYAREIEPGTWFATVAGLDGAWGDGDTADEARSELREALVGWIAVKRRFGYDVPAIEGLDLNLPQATKA